LREGYYDADVHSNDIKSILMVSLCTFPRAVPRPLGQPIRKRCSLAAAAALARNHTSEVVMGMDNLLHTVYMDSIGEHAVQIC
jgi:hypothetical protein